MLAATVTVAVQHCFAALHTASAFAAPVVCLLMPVIDKLLFTYCYWPTWCSWCCCCCLLGISAVLLQVLPPIAQELWDELRPAVLHYCRPTSGDGFSRQARRAAQKHMRKYAELLEVHNFPNYMFSWNLHWAVCRLPKQELERGSTGADGEWWSERVMQLYKKVVDGRVSHDTEQVWVAAEV
jgi:hypothetical protein